MIAKPSREWPMAEMLMLAAEGKAPLMFAHIGVLKALHARKPEARSPGLMLVSSST